jgi:hypothetical protein
MLCNVTETGNTPLNITALNKDISINLNGHTYLLNNPGSTATISNGNLPSKITLFNGTIGRTGSTGGAPVIFTNRINYWMNGIKIITNNAPGATSAALFVSGTTIVGKDTTVEAPTTTQYALHSSGGEIIDVIIDEGTASFSGGRSIGLDVRSGSVLMENGSSLIGASVFGKVEATGGYIIDSTVLNPINGTAQAAITVYGANVISSSGLTRFGNVGSGIVLRSGVTGNFKIDKVYGEGGGTTGIAGQAGISIEPGTTATGKIPTRYEITDSSGVGIDGAYGIAFRTYNAVVANNVVGTSDLGIGVYLGPTGGGSSYVTNLTAVTKATASTGAALWIGNDLVGYNGVNAIAEEAGPPAIFVAKRASLVKFSAVSEGAPGVVCATGVTGSDFIQGIVSSKLNAATGHGIILRGRELVAQCTIALTSAAANNLWSPSAISVLYTSNIFTRGTTAVHSNITQGLTATEDNQGNIRI